MSETADARSCGYDEMAEAYDRWWGPVIRPAAVRVLDVIAPAVEAALEAKAEPRLLDLGTGTGALAIAALERWPGLRVTGIDPSAGMLEVARRNAGDQLPPEVAERYETVVAWADELPQADASFDLAVSSFVLQLVPSRTAALREVRRVLQTGSEMAWVAWQRSNRAFEPDRIANDILDEAGFDPPEPDRRPGDITSPAAAAVAMRRAGFRKVSATAGESSHAWDAEGYLGFFTRFDEASLFDELDRGERRDIERELRRRLRRLSAEELTLRLPVIYASGRNS